MRLIQLALFVGLFAAHAHAQTTVTDYVVKVYMAGASSPVTTTSLPIAAFFCGQPDQPASDNPLNPTVLALDDWSNPARDCVYIDPGTGPLVAIPSAAFGSLELTVAGVNNGLVGQESARVPFRAGMEEPPPPEPEPEPPPPPPPTTCRVLTTEEIVEAGTTYITTFTGGTGPLNRHLAEWDAAGWSVVSASRAARGNTWTIVLHCGPL